MRTNSAVPRSEVAAEETEAHRHRHQRDRHRGQQLEDERGQEGHVQRGHGGGAVLVGDVDHRGLTCALARPKTFRVGRPATISRKCPARRWRRSAWRRIRPAVDAPTSDMNRGMSGRVTAMMKAETQSAPEHHHDHGHRDDDRQEELREVAGEVGCRGRRSRWWPARPGGRRVGCPRRRDPRRAIRSARAERRFDLADAEARSAIRSPSQATAARAEDGQRQQDDDIADPRPGPVMDNHVRDGGRR